MTADLETGTSLTPGSQASGTVDTGVSLTFSGSPTGGTFTVTVAAGGSSVATAAQTYSSSYAASALATALQGLTNVGSGNLLVSGSNGGPFTITAPAAFTASLSVTSALTGGTSPTASITEIPKTIATVAAGSGLILKTARLANRNAYTAVTFTVWATPPSQTRDATRIIVPPCSLAANDTTALSEIQDGMYEPGFAFAIGTGALVNAANYLLTGAVIS